MKVFVDTNILLYAHDSLAGDKHRIAESVTDALWQTDLAVVSIQVLHELYAGLVKFGQRAGLGPVSVRRARDIVETYLEWPIEILPPNAVMQASVLQEHRRVSFWDALIVLAASQARAAILLTEDLNHGQVIEGLRIHNPFLGEPLPALA